MNRPAFLITIDTEGDNLWARPKEITTANSRYLARFQNLCEKHNFRPTYLVNWEMSNCPIFADFGNDLIRRNAGEIGMHLHAWNSPPISPLSADDFATQPFLIEYPDNVLRAKIDYLTKRLEDQFLRKMLSHRAGRWAFNETYARSLVEHGYRVDCSVTPGVSWSHMLGNPAGEGGSDYRSFPTTAYFLNHEDIGRAGDLPLLEIPVSIHERRLTTVENAIRNALASSRYGVRVAQRLLPTACWFRPNGRNRKSLIRMLELAFKQNHSYVEFILHSSELMPGGSPRFPTARSIENLYKDLGCVFEYASKRLVGQTLAEFADNQPPTGPGSRVSKDPAIA